MLHLVLIEREYVSIPFPIVGKAESGRTVSPASFSFLPNTYVKSWITETGGEIRKTVIEAWNAMDKKVRNAYDKVAKKLEDWMNDIKELVQEIGTKISDAADKAKDVVIDKKDKALVWGIQKGVKGLSKNYTEDQVVALVRKCYNESVVPNTRTGNIVINEAYLHAKGSRARMLYERKMARRGKLLK
jgi:hypothetical protein